MDADDLYDTKSSESSEDVVVADVPAEPALNTVACEDEDDDVALDLLRIALYSSVDNEDFSNAVADPDEAYALRNLNAESPYLLPPTTPLLSSSLLV